MIKQGVILASGLGSRFNSEGVKEPKLLLPVGGVPLIERIITLMQLAGIEKIVVVVGYRGSQIIDYVNKRELQGVVFVENKEFDKKNGISLLRSKEALDLDSPFLLSMSDHIFSNDFLPDFLAKAEPLLADFDAILSVDRNIDGVFDIDDATKVVTEERKIVKIAKALKQYDAVDTGLFLCTGRIFDELQERYDKTGDVSVSNGMEALSKAGRFGFAEMTGHLWQDVDTPRMKGEAEQRLIDNYLSKTPKYKFFSNTLLAKLAKETALRVLAIEHFDWWKFDTVFLVLTLLVVAVSLGLDIVFPTILPLIGATLIYYIDDIRCHIRPDQQLKIPIFFSYKFFFALAVTPAVLNFFAYFIIDFALLLAIYAVVLSDLFGYAALLSDFRDKLPAPEPEFAERYLSPSLFCLLFTLALIFLPKSLVAIFPLVYILVDPIFFEKARR